MASKKKNETPKVAIEYEKGSMVLTTRTGQVLTVPAGAAGAVVTFMVLERPIQNSKGDKDGAFGDTSFSFTAGTVCTTEVATAALVVADGDYHLDYNTGLITTQKADNTTTMTCSYKIYIPNSSATLGSATVTVDSEFPTAAALADTTANPTTTVVGAMLEGFNGTTWDRLRSDTTNGLDVDVTRLPALVAGSAKIGAVDTDADATVGAAVPTVGLAVAGTDGTNARLLKTDTSGELQVDVLTMPSVTVDSEFPAAAALTDNFANPTTTNVAAMVMGFDGVTWDRVANGGGTEASALRVTVASDSTGVLSVDDNASSLTVDNSTLSVVGGGLEATALRVTLASDSTGLVSVDDNAGSLTVDSAQLPAALVSGRLDVVVGAALPTGANKVGSVDLDSDATIAAAVPTVAQFVAGTDGTNARALKTDTNGELQVDVLTMPTITVDSEFPAAATLADATINPSTTSVGSMSHLFNGTTWDRVRGDITNGLDVDVTRLPALVAGTASIGVLGANSGVDIGDVTINNATGGSAVNIQDGGNSITVDGSVSVTGTVDTELPAASALADAASATPTTPTVGSVPLLMNATTIDRQRAVVNSLDSTGTGVAASGLVAQLDDTAPSTVTENQFGTVRMSSRRTLYATPDSYAVDDSAMPATPNTMPVSGEYRSSATTYTDGDVTVLQANVRGAIKVDNDTALDADIDDVSTKPLQPSNINTAALAASLVIKASSGRLIEVRGYNNSTSSQFIQIHDAAALPADTAVPEEVITVPATSNFSISFDSWKNFATGIVVVNSSTAATKTIGAADCWFSADYV